MTIKLNPVAHQHFAGSGKDDVEFGGAEIVGRSVRHLILTTSGGVSISFDGSNFLPVCDGTHTFNVPLRRIWFEGGTWSGIGTGV